MQQTDLSSALGLSPDANTYLVMWDQSTNLEYLRNTREIAEHGLFVELNAYGCHTFVDIRQVQDDEFSSYRRLYKYLGGRGVPSVQQALVELLLQPVLNPFQQIANQGYFQYLLDARCLEETQRVDPDLLTEAENKYDTFLDGIHSLAGLELDTAALQQRLSITLDILLSWPQMDQIHYPLPGGNTYQAALAALKNGLDESPERWLVLFAFLFVRDIGKAGERNNSAEQSLSSFQEWRLSSLLTNSYQAFGFSAERAADMVNVIQLLLREQGWLERRSETGLYQCMADWLFTEEIQRFLGVNRHKSVLWYNKELFEEFVWWMTVSAVLTAVAKPEFTASSFVELVLSLDVDVQTLVAAQEESNYQVALLLEALKQ
jgi:hypothetical protein